MPLPKILLDPPWRRRAPLPPPATRRAAAMPSALAWLPGEREIFAGERRALSPDAEERLLERSSEVLRRGGLVSHAEITRLGDEKLAELAEELTGENADAATLAILLGRLGERVLERAIALVRAAPRERGLFDAALPICSPALAKAAARVVFDREVPLSLEARYTRSRAEAWMLRHPEAVAAGDAGDAAVGFLAAHGALARMAPYLEDPARFAAFERLAPLARARPWALVLAARGDPRARAALEGEPCAVDWLARLEEERAARALAEAPAASELPDFFDPPFVACPRTREGEPVEGDALRALGEMLRFSPQYSGLVQVERACEPRSLDDFALELFRRWCAAGEPTRELWALESCGKIGGERAANAVVERVRAWAERSTESPYAKLGCAVLARRGRDHLERLARDAPQAWLRAEASALLGPVLRPQVSAPVPSVGLGLAPDGALILTTGARVFRVRVDEHLTPVLEGEDGDEHASFPELAEHDDPATHALAKERFADLAKDAKAVARYQLALLERMMSSGRSMSAATFRARFLEHTFLRHVGRRIVWRADGVCFRVAEDGSFADARDARFELSGVAAVEVAHPAIMTPAEREAWRTRLSDYEIVQPFAQIEREVHALAPHEKGAREITRVIGRPTTRARIFELTKRGWKPRIGSADASEYERELPCGAVVCLAVKPVVGYGAKDTEHTVTLATCTLTLDQLPAIELSELARDLEALVRLS